MSDTGPLFVSSGDLIADRRYKWALDHVAQRFARFPQHAIQRRRAGCEARAARVVECVEP